MIDMTLIIPVYNEAQSIERLAGHLDKLPEMVPQIREIILVEDGSSDLTREKLKKHFPQDGNVRIVYHDRNRGYGASLKTGISEANHEWIAIADADETYPLKDLRPLAKRIEAGARMAVGARRLSHQPAVRRPAKAFLNTFASYLVGVKIPDINSGLRIFRREDAKRHENMLPSGFSFTTTITMALLSEGHSVAFVPIHYKERRGSSKIRPLRDMNNFLVLICRMALAFNPLRIFGPAGSLLAIAGLVLLFARLFGSQFGVATTVILFIGGLQLWAVGFLADLINRRN